MDFRALGRNNPTINVTSLIDILLVLLVTFLLIAPVTSKGEEAGIPRRPLTENEVDPRVVVLQLRPTAGSSDAVELTVNHEKVEWSALHNMLQQIFKMRGDKTLFLTSDRKVDFRYVAQVADAAHAAGVENVALMPSDKP